MFYLDPRNILHVKSYVHLEDRRKIANEFISPYNFAICYFKGADRRLSVAIADGPDFLEDITLLLMENLETISAEVQEGRILTERISEKMLRKLRTNIRERRFDYLIKCAPFFSNLVGWPI